MHMHASYRIIDNKNNGFKYEATKKNVKTLHIMSKR